MYTSNTLRDRYVDEALTTASGPKIVVMCFDRVDRDISSALDAIEAGDIAVAHDALCHAQDLVNELLCMLDLDVWEHAASLAAIYRYVIELLTAANVGKRPGPAAEARRLLAELGDAFRQAAAQSPKTERPASAEQAFSVRA